jgi:hypothetical protein
LNIIILEINKTNAIIDLRPIAERYGSIADVKIFSDEDLLTDKWGGTTLTK